MKMNILEMATNYTEVLIKKLSARYKFDAADALEYVRSEAALKDEVSVEEKRGRPEKKAKKVVNKGEMVEETIETILAEVAPTVVAPTVVAPTAVVEVEKPKKKVAKKKVVADAPAVVAEVVTEVAAEVVEPVVAVEEKPKKKAAAKKPKVVATEAVVIEAVVVAPAAVVTEVAVEEKPKKKAAAKKAEGEEKPKKEPKKKAEGEEKPKKEPKKKVEGEEKPKKEPKKAEEKPKKEPKKKVVETLVAAVVEEPKIVLTGELTEEVLTEEEDDEEEYAFEDWIDTDGTKYYLIKEKDNLLLDYESQTPAGRLVDGEKVDLDEDEE